MLSRPNFSRYASASTNATSLSATTAQAGTAHVSLRSFDASSTSNVSRFTVSSGVMSVGMGFMAALTMRGMPVVMPPSRPPALFDVRTKPTCLSSAMGSCTSEPTRRAASNPRPNSTPLMAGMENSAAPKREVRRSPAVA